MSDAGVESMYAAVDPAEITDGLEDAQTLSTAHDPSVARADGLRSLHPDNLSLGEEDPQTEDTLSDPFHGVPAAADAQVPDQFDDAAGRTRSGFEAPVEESELPSVVNDDVTASAWNEPRENTSLDGFGLRPPGNDPFSDLSDLVPDDESERGSVLKFLRRD